MTISVVAIISAVFSIMLKKYNAELSTILSICACAGILIWIIAQTVGIFSQVITIAEHTNINTDYLKIVFKAIGICFITEFAYNCCVDAGQTALASNTLLAGKLSVIISVLPLFEEILNIALELIGI